MNAHTPSVYAYNQGCRCDGCRLAGRRYRKGLRLDHERGIYRTTDAAQVRVHLQRLLALGWTQEQIGLAAGISQASVSSILTRQSKVGMASARAIFDIHLRRCPVTPDGWTDATGSRRRLQALAVIGYSPYALAPTLNLAVGWLYEIIAGKPAHISGRDALRIAALYRRLLRLPAPVGHGPDRTRRRAARLGWHGPTAWDQIDDPMCEPEDDPAAPGIPSQVDDERIRQLTTEGLSAQQIAERLGCTPRTVQRARARLRAAEEVAA